MSNKKSLTQTLVNIRDEFIERYPEDHKQIADLAEHTRAIFAALFKAISTRDASGLKWIKERVEERLETGEFNPSFIQEYRAAINLLCYQWADPGLDLIEWGVIEKNLQEVPEVRRARKGLLRTSSRLLKEVERFEQMEVDNEDQRRHLVFQLYDLAQKLAADNCHDDAIRCYYQAYELSRKQFIHATNLMADIDGQCGRPVEANMNRKELTPKGWQWLGDYHEHQGQAPEAMAAYQQGYALCRQTKNGAELPLEKQFPNPQIAPLVSGLSRHEKDLDKRFHYTRMATHHQADNPENWMNRALLHAEEGKNTEAFRFFKKAIVASLNRTPFKMSYRMHEGECTYSKVNDAYKSFEAMLADQLEKALSGKGEFLEIDGDDCKRTMDYYNYLAALLGKEGIHESLEMAEWQIHLARGLLYYELARCADKLDQVRNRLAYFGAAYPVLEEAIKKMPALFHKEERNRAEHALRISRRLVQRIDLSGPRQGIGRVDTSVIKKV